MDQQTIDLVKDILVGVKTTAEPVWNQTVTYIYYDAVFSLVALLLLCAVLAFITKSAFDKWKESAYRASKTRHRNGQEIELPCWDVESIDNPMTAVVCMVGMVVLSLTTIPTILHIPTLLATINSPEGYIVMQTLKKISE